jgi:plasmid stability protein
MRSCNAHAALSVSSAIVRELGQPWQKKIGAPFLSPYSETATERPPARAIFWTESLISTHQCQNFDNHYGVFMVASMPNITLKNIPRDLHRRLKSRAKAHHRSLNKEAIAALQSVIREAAPLDVKKLIAEAREMRSKFKGETSLREIQAMKIAGRRR